MHYVTFMLHRLASSNIGSCYKGLGEEFEHLGDGAPLEKAIGAEV